MLPLVKEELKSYQDANVCYICGKKILKNLSKNINFRKVRDHSHITGNYRDAANSICNLTFNVSNEIPLVFQKASNYDYHFIIKELTNESEGQLECLEENTVRYRTFSVPKEKEVTKIDTGSNENVLAIT